MQMNKRAHRTYDDFADYVQLSPRSGSPRRDIPVYPASPPRLAGRKPLESHKRPCIRCGCTGWLRLSLRSRCCERSRRCGPLPCQRILNARLRWKTIDIFGCSVACCREYPTCTSTTSRVSRYPVIRCGHLYRPTGRCCRRIDRLAHRLWRSPRLGGGPIHWLLVIPINRMLRWPMHCLLRSPSRRLLRIPSHRLLRIQTHLLR